MAFDVVQAMWAVGLAEVEANASQVIEATAFSVVELTTAELGFRSRRR